MYLGEIGRYLHISMVWVEIEVLVLMLYFCHISERNIVL